MKYNERFCTCLEQTILIWFHPNLLSLLLIVLGYCKKLTVPGIRSWIGNLMEKRIGKQLFEHAPNCAHVQCNFYEIPNVWNIMQDLLITSSNTLWILCTHLLIRLITFRTNLGHVNTFISSFCIFTFSNGFALHFCIPFLNFSFSKTVEKFLNYRISCLSHRIFWAHILDKKLLYTPT